MSYWTQAEAIAICTEIEGFCPDFGCHVALTGGTLYKSGQRKDCDILFYRIRQVSEIDREGLTARLESMGVKKIAEYGWMMKATYNGKKIDLFFPEYDDGEFYVNDGLETLIEEVPA